MSTWYTTGIHKWYTTHIKDGIECNVDEDTMLSNVEDCRRAIKTKVEVETMIKELLQETKELRSLFQKFSAEFRANSKMFTFWEKYGDVVKLL